MLARRDHSRYELGRKLARYSRDDSEIGPLLDDLERCGWLSDRHVVEQATLARRRRFGTRRIVRELREKGISSVTINAELPKLMATEVAAAHEIWRKKFGAPPADSRDKARQIRFLQGRGFGGDTIRKIMSGTMEDE
jgi:regulatory protein